MKRLSFLGFICLLLTSCSGYPRIVNYPFDSQGRSLNSPANDNSPQMSERYIAFVSDRNGSQDIYVYDTQTRRLIDLPGLNVFNEIADHPAVSLDGRYIVFCATIKGKSDIFLFDRTTEQKRNLTENLDSTVRNPVISADGSTIAYEIAKDGQWDIRIVDITGKMLRE